MEYAQNTLRNGNYLLMVLMVMADGLETIEISVMVSIVFFNGTIRSNTKLQWKQLCANQDQYKFLMETYTNQ